MADSRVQVISADVADVLRKSHGVFDAIILDIDNGASAMSSESNKRLYQSAGLALARSALKSDGCLAVWSASDDPVFAKTMTKAGFHVIVERARAHPSSGSWHTLFIGRVA